MECKILDEFNISSFNSKSITIKDIKSDSIISKNDIKFCNSDKNSYSLEGSNDYKSFEDNYSTDYSNNNELNDFYDNFYN